MLKFFSIICLVILLSCTSEKATDKAQTIIDKAIKAHGSSIFDKANVEFKFRDRNYKSSRLNGKFSYNRFWDSTGVIIHDEYTNTGLIRHVGNVMARPEAKKIDAWKSSINAVFYFFALPFNLNDPGLNKEYLGEAAILDKKYDKIKISFVQNPGDNMIHDDTYVYWFNQKDHMLDYLGYDYTEPDEKGQRFRQAINRRIVNGLTVQDYINFKPSNDTVPIAVDKLDDAFLNKQLVELSKIINENVRVTPK